MLLLLLPRPSLSTQRLLGKLSALFLLFFPMGSVGEDYRCPLCGRTGMGGYSADWIGFPICTNGVHICLDNVCPSDTSDEEPRSAGDVVVEALGKIIGGVRAFEQYSEVALIQLSHEQAEVEGALRLTRGSAASQVQVINSWESSVHLQVQETRRLSGPSYIFRSMICELICPRRIPAASRLLGVTRVGKVGRIPLAAVMAMPIVMRKWMLDDRAQGYGLDTFPTVPATACSGRSTSLRRGFLHEILIRVRLRDVTRGRIPFEPLRDATQDLMTCAYCFSKHPKMKECIGCRWALYCNRGCQVAHWPAHRHICCPDHCLPIGQDFIALSSVSEGVLATVTEAREQGEEPDLSVEVDRRDAAQDLKTCDYCFSKQPKMKKCSGCRWARYCNRGCQTAHWRAHRLMCRPWPYLSEGAVATLTEGDEPRSGVFSG